MRLTHKIKVDRISWLILSGAIALVIVIIALYATAEYPYGGAPMFTIQSLAFLLFLAFFIRVGIIKNKPPMDKYEITLFGLIIGLVMPSFLLLELRILNFFGSMLLVFVAIALMVIAIAYHVDRKAEWEKEQQALQQPPLQN